MLSSGVKNILKSLHLNVFYESKRKLVVIVSVIKLATFLFTVMLQTLDFFLSY